MRRRSLVGVVLVFAAGMAGGWMLRSKVSARATVRAAPPLKASIAAIGENGLTPQDRASFYHLSEGGELFPLDWALALEVETPVADGTVQVRPFLDDIERYGLLADGKHQGNPYGLPVGVSLARAKTTGVEMIGLNCSACHVGQVQYQNHAVRVDGAGNMVLVNKFLQDLATETERTMKAPHRLARFWERLREIRRERRAGGVDAPAAEDERVMRRLAHLFTSNRGLLEAQVNALRNVPTLARSIAISTQEGYGRLDAFGIGRDELFGAIGANSLPADAPVSIPHVWGMEYTGWLQWGANTNSVMERNIGQALGVGALLDAKTFESTVRLDNLHTLEGLAYKITPPTWPDAFPPIDQARAETGRGLFYKYCAGCHETFKTDGQMRTYQLFPLDEVGTDPMTAINYERQVQLKDGSTAYFPDAALDLIVKVKTRAYEDLKLDAKTIAEWEQRAVRKGPQWDPTFRAPLLQSERFADTKGRRVYRAKTLVGIWATAPFLHNGSVPTIYDLLRPAADRPVSFPTGQREYDPAKLGLQTDPSKFTLPPGLIPFTFDTRLRGNWNTGHEWNFYPTLTDDLRYAIIEFLKTYTREPPNPGTPPRSAD
ncbi:MAG TPA: di-heme-cytochrome C peroxidase [Vicinamibacterales bacterium]|nr:di-heme-cytochrome C peroxidase [Vicinamibacterales bacterium]